MSRTTMHTAAEFETAYGSRTWDFYRPLLAQLLQYAAPGPVLDVGAGLGLFVECCRRFGVPCIGLEGSPEGVERALARGVRLVRGDVAAGLPFRASAFASVTCIQVIEHVEPESARALLAEARRVLQPGGTLLLQSPSPRDPIQRREPGHINLYMPSRLRREVAEAGFEVIAEPNGPITPLGQGRLRSLLFLALLRLSGWNDVLSATANVVARRR
jgi:SAM-dependent methyltransferase